MNLREIEPGTRMVYSEDGNSGTVEVLRVEADTPPGAWGEGTRLYLRAVTTIDGGGFCKGVPAGTEFDVWKDDDLPQCYAGWSIRPFS